MRPFNLDLWEAGEPVITRNGQKVEQLTKFDLGHKFMLAGVVDETFLLWEIDGSYFHDSEKSNFDLFHPDTRRFVLLVDDIKNGEVIPRGIVYYSHEAAIVAPSLSDFSKAKFLGVYELVKVEEP
jgi:hypothetical protein